MCAVVQCSAVAAKAEALRAEVGVVVEWTVAATGEVATEAEVTAAARTVMGLVGKGVEGEKAVAVRAEVERVGAREYVSERVSERW